MIDCVYSDPEDAMKLLQELSIVSRPLMISFTEMITLMSQCQLVDAPQTADTEGTRRSVPAPGLTATDRPGLLANNPFTLFSGIIPGTYYLTIVRHTEFSIWISLKQKCQITH